jgi:2-oxo-4-hydroxy-4-carboxy-5-ureidoimidazoline decarboxylase
MTWLDRLNASANDDRSTGALTACCASPDWVARVLAARPFANAEELYAASDEAIAAVDDAAIADALAAHPRIGERPSGPDGAWSRQEQAGVSSAASAVLADIADANAEYERQFGHVYLVCATGKSAEELLDICRARLGNDAATEAGVVREELAKITRIRLGKLLNQDGAE